MTSFTLYILLVHLVHLGTRQIIHHVIRISAVSQMKDEEYQTLHKDPQSSQCSVPNCRFLGPPGCDIEEIIRSSGIPICWVVAQEGNHFKIEAAKAENGQPYMAISHVWSHGLGNPLANTLPVSQLIWLQYIVNCCAEFHPGIAMSNINGRECFMPNQPHWFWMDTLCVSTHLDAKPLRKQAITKMRETFAGATGVVVLDRDLRSIGREQNPTMTETLQESVFTKKVLIPIHGGIIVFDDLCRLFEYRLKVEPETELISTCYTIWKSLYARVLSKGFDGLLQELSHRRTSKSSDETIYLTTLLGFNIGPLFEIADDEGLLSDEEICDGRMANEDPPRLEGRRDSEITDGGLQVKLGGLLFSPKSDLLSFGHVMVYEKTCETPLMIGRISNNLAPDDKLPFQKGHLALITQQPITEDILCPADIVSVIPEPPGQKCIFVERLGVRVVLRLPKNERMFEETKKQAPVFVVDVVGPRQL
ncbi:MAG: hypothetical protein M1834_000723 [Cirrosporium novae-zelandiae]|nr:MAG: hypothetical protein M1834_000723 [Cirrosporium novae-zelandiae]